MKITVLELDLHHVIVYGEQDGRKLALAEVTFGTYEDDQAKSFMKAFKGKLQEFEMVNVPVYDDVERDFVVEYLHYNGKKYVALNNKQRMKVMELADGFGRIDKSMENYEDMFWDWSHIRDSSPKAFKDMKNKIEEILKGE